MKTESIINYVSGLDNPDFNNILELSIDRLSIDGMILEVNLEDLYYFPNVEKLTLKNLQLNFEDLEIISKLNLKELSFINCDLCKDSYIIINILNLNNLIVNNSNIDVSKLTGYLNELKIIGIDYASNDLETNELDISRAHIDNLEDMLKIKTKILIISRSQYIEELKQLIGSIHIIIKSDNMDYIEEEI